MTAAQEQSAMTDAADGKQVAHIVSGKGTDDEIRARCAESVAGWDKLGEQAKDDLVRLMRQFWQMPTAPRMEIERSESGALTIGAPETQNITLAALRCVETFGSKSQEYGHVRISELANFHNASSGQGCTSDLLSASLAFVHGAKPADPVQSTLAVEMVATHDAAMRALGRSGKAEFVEQAQVFGNLAVKLLNVYARQAEVLAKLQRGGEQVIKHVHIDNRGGQAVVAEQFIKGGSGDEQRDHSHALGAAMWGENAAGVPLQITGDPREEAVPNAQRAGKGEAGQ